MTLLGRPFRGILIAIWAVQCALFWPAHEVVCRGLRCLPAAQLLLAQEPRR